jgi:hypothetical protein
MHPRPLFMSHAQRAEVERWDSWDSVGLIDHAFACRRTFQAVLLPNGPEAAVCVLAVSTYCTCAPINMQLKVLVCSLTAPLSPAPE